MMKPSRVPNARSDLTFAWAAVDPTLTAWRDALAAWAAQHSGRGKAIQIGNMLLDYLQAHPSVARSPEEFCRRTYVNPHPFRAWVSDGLKTKPQITNAARTFFGWYLENHLTAPSDSGRAILSPDHENPILRTRLAPHPSETARQALPTRLIRELFDLLTADDWAWAKTQKADWMYVGNSETGQFERMWCPVRASAIALKLLLPLRTFQVRMLESGESDSECYVQGAWHPNRSQHAPPPDQRTRRGFLRKFEDRATGAVSTGFFINTNKTADRLPTDVEAGYEIPWQHDEAISVVDQLLRWQLKHNPVEEPLAWASLHDNTVMISAPRPGKAFFLMRDPTGKHRNEPIVDQRLQWLWHQLVSALEDRLVSRGERMADGSTIRLTRYVKIGHLRPTGRRQSIYDLHTMRVSLLTALAVDGGVPLHILSKCVAGHASIVMTLYYLKVDPATINERLSEATAKIDSTAQAQFAQYLLSESRGADGFVSNGDGGLAALDGSTVASWTLMDTGICPVGGTRCADGGPLLAKNVYGPVPGGHRNCVRCRFHITGPAFLGGLVARFNAASMRVESAKRERQAAIQALREAEDRRADQENAGSHDDGRDLARARERRERAEATLAAATGTLQAVYVLVERSKSVPARSSGSDLSLVLVGTDKDCETAVRQTSDVDLFDTVCQAADVYPCDEVSEASLRRSQALDRMLTRNGRPPMMMHLSEAEALRAGNEMMHLMTLQLGREEALQVVDGTHHAMLDGVGRCIDSLLARVRVPQLEGPPAAQKVSLAADAKETV